MKLISCHVLGFGKFVNSAMDLSAPVMFIRGENGWGKTTLADFLESMFYGIDGGRSKVVADNNRLKYEPWSGAKFGGALTFEYGGKQYRVERTFGKSASADTVAVYDENNMQCYLFGERAERLGETVFGVDRDSFKSTAYFPQGALTVDGVSAGLKEKLTALLSVNKQDNGSQSAMERLDKAERALRSKRKPGKGKLDEIDEKLDYVRGQKADSANAVSALEIKREDGAKITARLTQINTELSRMGARVEEYARRNELYANQRTRKEIERSLSDTENKIKQLSEFFAGVTPQALNTDGLEKGIEEFYALKSDVEKLKAEKEKLSATVLEKETLQAKLDASEQTLENFELLLDEQDRADRKSEKADRKNEKFAKKRVSHAFWLMAFCLAIAFVGAILVDVVEILGIIILAGGTFGVLYALVQMIRYTQSKRRKKRVGFADAEMEERYEKAQEEVQKWQLEMKKYPAKIDEEFAKIGKEIESKETRATQLNDAIVKFLSNFRFKQQYDYRAALAFLKDSATQYDTCVKTAKECEDKLRTLPVSTLAEEDFSPADMDKLALEKRGLENEKERLGEALGRIQAEMDALEKTAGRIGDLEAEEERLGLEKTRLEKRLVAVQYAKEILLRARANMATKYLDPVEKRMKEYAVKMGLGSWGESLRLQADGKTLTEDTGAFRSTEYYSVGLQDLFALCMRFALAECIYPNGGIFILDDPFVNLDDDKTARAKSLVQELATRYQILYLTCKQERSL